MNSICIASMHARILYYTCDRDDTSNDKRTKAKLTKISLAKLTKAFSSSRRAVAAAVVAAVVVAAVVATAAATTSSSSSNNRLRTINHSAYYLTITEFWRLLPPLPALT